MATQQDINAAVALNNALQKINYDGVGRANANVKAFENLGGQAKLNALMQDPQINSYLAAGSSMFSGDLFPILGTGAAFFGAAAGLNSMGLLGQGASAGAGAGAGIAPGMSAAELAAVDPYLASIGGASGITPAMETAGIMSAAGAPGVAASTAAGNVATGLGYDAATNLVPAGLSNAQIAANLEAGQYGGMTGSLTATDVYKAALSSGSTAAEALNAATSYASGGLSTSGLLSGGLNALGSYLQGSSASDAATNSANAQIEAARIAAESAKFRPVGITTNFGASQFGYDAAGNLNSAGYALNPQLQAQQNQLMGMSGGLLDQYQGTQAATAPMGQAAQTMFGLGKQYLQQTPQQQAAQYMAEQQALIAAPRANQLADIQERLNAQGRGGLAVGGNAGQMASNPELAAYYNALQQQDLGLAAQATKGGMDYANFGANMVGQGGNMLNSMYGTQTAAYNPYQTALGGATTIEGLGQNAMDLGINIGAKGAAAGGNAGQLLQLGLLGAAKTRQQADAYNPWAAPLAGAANMLQGYSWGT